MCEFKPWILVKVEGTIKGPPTGSRLLHPSLLEEVSNPQHDQTREYLVTRVAFLRG